MRPGPSLIPLALLAVCSVVLLGNGCNEERPLEWSFHCERPVAGPYEPLGVTTEARTILPASRDPYRVLVPCAGWPRQARSELVEAAGVRERSGRIPLLSLAHLSDVHIIDAESPMRIEFLRHARGTLLPPAEFQAAFRPQETMTTQVAEAMVRQLNAFPNGPVTGRKLDLLVATGDSGDNHQWNELERFIDLLNGGATITPGSGGPSYEGVQDRTPSPLYAEYWHPDPTPGVSCAPRPDGSCPVGCGDEWYGRYCFRPWPGLLGEVTQPFTATGVKLRWFTAYGNHDRLLQGNFAIRPGLPPVGSLSSIATGGAKRLQLPDRFRSEQPDTEKLLVDLFLAEFLDPLDGQQDWRRFRDAWTKPPTRSVVADPSRRLRSESEFVQALLDRPGPHGPAGHGFSSANRDEQTLYYAFDLASRPRIRGLVLDTTNPGGMADGSIGPAQLAWIESELQKVSSVYTTRSGERKHTGNADALVVLFSHHNLQTLGNTFPHLLDSDRTTAAAFERILHGYPNVVLWLNGHTHFNRVTPHRAPDGRHGFWEITSPSLIDFPQMARVIELTDNRDGTLSIFATLVDHAAPADPDATTGLLRLASLSRQLAANDPLLDLSRQIGSPSDRNVELLVRAPFELTPREP